MTNETVRKKRPEYDSPIMRERELIITQTWCINRGGIPKKLPVKLSIDFIIVDNLEIGVEWLEVRERERWWNPYFLPVYKWKAMRQLAHISKIPAGLLVYSLNDQCFHHWRMDPKNTYQCHWYDGNNESRDDPQDEEPMIWIPSSEFTAYEFDLIKPLPPHP